MMMMRMSQFFVKNSFSIGRAGWGDSVRLHGLWLFLSYITNNSFPHIQIFVFNKYKQPRFLEWNIRLRRGVRFGVQLSCTETRFQKCSQSGKNGSKHPMSAKTCFAHILSFLLGIYSSWGDPEQGWIWQSAVGPAWECKFWTNYQRT